ncbi:hypothetical protein D3C71_2019260 [compost metagenome]
MQRISVDLPEPDGPQITMRSPCRTDRLMSVSTWKLSYHLLTPSIVMMGGAPVVVIVVVTASVIVKGS